MYLKDLDSTLVVWKCNLNLSIESTRSEQGLIKNLWDVRSGKDDNTGVTLETIHFGEELVDSLLSFVIAHAHALVPLSAD